MKFIHMADMHFDAPFVTLAGKGNLATERRLEQRNVMKQIVEYIKQNNIPYLFIAGDLYEQEYIKKATIEYINNLFKEIPDTKIFITPGNHDPNIIFTNKIERIECDGVDIYGYGFNDFQMERPKQDIEIKDKNKINYFLLTFTFILSFIVTVFFKNNLNLSQELSNNFESFFKLFITGIIFISGKVIPGLSSSCMLMMIGMYSYYINIMSNPLTYTLNNPIQMIFIILGIIVGAVIFIKLMNYLLNKYYSTTYSLIIGFVLGSLIVMYPNTINITGILTLFIGILVSYYFSTYLRK